VIEKSLSVTSTVAPPDLPGDALEEAVFRRGDTLGEADGAEHEAVRRTVEAVSAKRTTEARAPAIEILRPV
jgi:hypothetical protein